MFSFAEIREACEYLTAARGLLVEPVYARLCLSKKCFAKDQAISIMATMERGGIKCVGKAICFKGGDAEYDAMFEVHGRFGEVLMHRRLLAS